MIEKILFGDQLIAIIVFSSFAKQAIEFFTPDDFSQQLAYMSHPASNKIILHRHNSIPREVHYTQEVLFIRKGRVGVDFFNDGELYI